MRTVKLPLFNLTEVNGSWYLEEKDKFNELDGGYVNTLLEKISNMNEDETKEFLSREMDNMVFIKRGWQFDEKEKVRRSAKLV